MPVIGPSEHEKWLKVDSIVFSWILISISKDLIEAFFYANSAKELWEELAENFGEGNGPLLCQLKKEISSFTQGTMSVATCFTKMKKTLG